MSSLLMSNNNTPVKKILILAANPKNTSRLRLDEEVREIDEGLRRANKRELFQLEQKLAVRWRDFYRAILDTQPQIVHFCGHAQGEDGIALENETGNTAFVNADTLESIFKLFAQKGVECVVLNACYSKVQAEAISRHTNYVIGMNRSISDKAAINFAVAFYDALGAGQEVEFAFELGCSQLVDVKEHQTPILKKKLNITPTPVVSTDETTTLPVTESTTDAKPLQRIPLLGKKIPKQYYQKIKLGLILSMSGLLSTFWFCLPIFSNMYNRNGLDNFDKQNFSAAEQNFKRAIFFNANNAEAYYNLGNLYEEWKQIEKAKQQYRIAIKGNLPEAYNNLGRLYIKDKKYPDAAEWLIKGLEFTANRDLQKPELQYSFLKNLGWVRFKQGKYKEAASDLEIAISISTNPDHSQYIPNPGAAHCLMAQVLEQQKKSSSKALSQWQKCAELGFVTNPDEDEWLDIARQKLGEEKK